MSHWIDVEERDRPAYPLLVPQYVRVPDAERCARLEALLVTWFRDDTTRRAILEALRTVVGRD